MSMNIDINELAAIRDDLENLADDDLIMINDQDEPRFVIMPVTAFEGLEQFAQMLTSPGAKTGTPSVSIVGPNKLELSYDEYEQVRKQILDAFDKTFKPDPGKLS